MNIDMIPPDIQFVSMCYTVDLEIIKRFYNDYHPNIHYNDEEAFRRACFVNYLDLAKWLFSQSNGKLNIHCLDDISFRYACRYQYVDLTKWLLEISQFSTEVINNNIICHYDKSVYNLVFKLQYKLTSYKLQQKYKEYLQDRSKYFWFVCKVFIKMIMPFLIRRKYYPDGNGYQEVKNHFEKLVKIE